MDLNALLLPVEQYNRTQLQEFAKDFYCRHYCANWEYGVLDTHDQQEIAFYGNRFEHAFFTRRDWSKSAKKDQLDPERVRRIAWIKPLVSGQIPGSACWLIPCADNPKRTRRLYVIEDECFLVWLETWSPEQWWFSSTYIALRGQLRKYCDGGARIWRQK